MSLHSTYNEKERRYLTPLLRSGKNRLVFRVRPGVRPAGLTSATGAAYRPGPVSPSTVFFSFVTVDRHAAARPGRRENRLPLARLVRSSMSGVRGFREVPGGSLRRSDLNGDV